MSSAPAPSGARAGARGPGASDVVARHRGFAGRTVLISGLTLVSRVLGYVREILSAWIFGDSSGVFDAFITAWRVPNLFRRFLGEGALSTSLQTVLTEVDAERGDRAGARLFRATLFLVAGLALFVCAAVMLGVLVMPDAMPGTGWAWLGADPGPVRELTARLMPFVVLICLTATAGGALAVRGHFAAPAFAPVVLNVVWIGALVALARSFGTALDVEPGELMTMVRRLSWAVLLAGLLQLLVVLPALGRFGLLAVGPRDAQAWREALRSAWRVLQRAAPLALGAAVYQINVMIDGLMAEGLLPDGAPTLHYYANRVQQFPMALIAIAATSAVFPALAALGHERRLSDLRRLHDRTQRAVLFVALPAAVGLFVLATPIIAVSFERGAFGAEGVRRASDALRMLALALLPAGAVGLVARTYYAVGDFRTPVRVSSALLGLNAGLNLAFVAGLGMDVEGLALATAVSSALHLAWLLSGFGRRLGLPAAVAGFWSAAGRMALAAAGCGVAAFFVRGLLADPIGRGGALVGAMAAGAAAYFALAALLGVPEWRGLLERLSRRFRGPSGGPVS